MRARRPCYVNRMTARRLGSSRLAALALLVLLLLRGGAVAGPDDDAPFRSDGTTRNAVGPVTAGGTLADFPTNAEPTTGLRILPPSGTHLWTGQRFDLRVETQLPAQKAPVLESLRVNGTEIAPAFSALVDKQGRGRESGTPKSPLLYGATARNLSFDAAGLYRVEATLSVDGKTYRVSNGILVSQLGASDQAPRRIVFFLGDGMGLPVRTAARIAGRGLFEGRARSRLAMDRLDVIGLVQTSSFDSTITDSAPGMASYLTGMKQANGALNVSVDNTPEDDLDNPRVETSWELLKRTRGFRTGVVSDAFITDATPAATAVHTRSRKQRLAIAQQMLDFYEEGTAQPVQGFAALAELTQPLDVILGAGAVDWVLGTNPALREFYQYPDDAKLKRRADVDLLGAIAPSRGYTVVRTAEELQAAPSEKPLLGIFAGEFRRSSSGLGPDNVPGALDRLVARGKATIGGRGPDAPELGMTGAPPEGKGCGATVRDCFRAIPSKLEMVQKAVAVLDRLAGADAGWALLVEQSQTDKLGHTLEYERVVYDALELDEAVGWVLEHVARDGRTLVLVTADHAQPESNIGVVLTKAVMSSGATPPGGCFAGTKYAVTLGKESAATEPCKLQDVVGTFDDAAFPTYADENRDGYPDDPDPSVKLVIDDAGRPTYSQNYLTNPQPLEPASRESAALPNPARDPDGLLLTGNMPTRIVVGGANETEDNVRVAPHSADDVPLSAGGPGAELFSGVYDNADVHPRLGAALSGATQRRELDRGGEVLGVPATEPPASSLKGL